jgi:hypothetical protein
MINGVLFPDIPSYIDFIIKDLDNHERDFRPSERIKIRGFRKELTTIKSEYLAEDDRSKRKLFNRIFDK